ncbi:MAG: 4Fe-4S dicluster domain-containing protein [Geminicoccaceae bacterium]
MSETVVRDTFGLVPDWAEFALYVAFLPFAAAFAYGLYRRLIGLSLGRLLAVGAGKGGLRRLLRDALLQRRVAQRRRGWPHLAIFYGFLTLLFGTTVVAIDWDIVRPFGVRLLQGRTYLYLEALLDLLGLVFVIGLTAALVWRLVLLRRTGPDQRRVQLQFVALILALLVMGLSGYVLEALRFAIHPVPWAGWSFLGAHLGEHLRPALDVETARRIYLGLWWAHALLAFGIIAALPYTVFLHAVAAPLNVTVLPGRPAPALSMPFDLRQLLETGDFDVKVGVARLSDLEPDQRLALAACTNCGRCDSVCPAFVAGTELSPRRLVQTLRGVALAEDADADLLAGGQVTPGELWACTTCAACVEACPVLIRPVDYIVPFRRELVSRQNLEKRQVEFLANLGRSLNPYGLPAARRAELAAELAEPADNAH